MTKQTIASYKSSSAIAAKWLFLNSTAIAMGAAVGLTSARAETNKTYDYSYWTYVLHADNLPSFAYTYDAKLDYTPAVFSVLYNEFPGTVTSVTANGFRSPPLVQRLDLSFGGDMHATWKPGILIKADEGQSPSTRDPMRVRLTLKDSFHGISDMPYQGALSQPMVRIQSRPMWNDGRPGSTVEVYNHGTIETQAVDEGERSNGIEIGIQGGTGLNGSSGHSGYQGGHGGSVTVNNTGTIATQQVGASAITVQAAGGTGGNGGSGNTFHNAGTGAAGGDGGTITITNSGTLSTAGPDQGSGFDSATVVFAESLGGNGGDGGRGGWAAWSKAGDGGDGNSGGAVTVRNERDGTITARGDQSTAVKAISVGGNGGKGGTAVAINLDGAGALSLGGDAGDGGNGGEVGVRNDGHISVKGDLSEGLVAMSTGGGGGDGGGALSIGFAAGSVGGTGGGGGHGYTVGGALGGGSSLSVEGNMSKGVVLQSVGGGGGNGGWSAALSASVSVAVGGNGGRGGDGGNVRYTAFSGSRLTVGSKDSGSHGSKGVLAQSVGGGGGDGGLALTGTAGAANAGIALGGKAKGGGDGGDVQVFQKGRLVEVHGHTSNAVVAQSVGGGGGTGGAAFSANLTIGEAKAQSVRADIGGSGGAGGHGGHVSGYVGTGTTKLSWSEFTDITTHGQSSTAVVLQSIGGGGGNGGMVGGATFSAGFKSQSGELSIGGGGGNGGDGGTVTAGIDSGTLIRTDGSFSYGALIQSVGGGGGSGAHVMSQTFQVGGGTNTAKGGTQAYALRLGGSGGEGGHGGAIDTTIRAGKLGFDRGITTFGHSSHGVLAQSIGGGGGTGGSIHARTYQLTVQENDPNATEKPANSSNRSFSYNVAGDGGKGGNGGAVSVRLDQASVQTRGNLSDGILAQSVGGGGGVGGHTDVKSDQLKITYSNDPNDPESSASPRMVIPGKSSFDLQSGGSTLASGGAGRVTITLSGAAKVSTTGDASHGLVSQAVTGGGGRTGTHVIDDGTQEYSASVQLGRTKAEVVPPLFSWGAEITATDPTSAWIGTTGNGSFGMLTQTLNGGGGVTGHIVAPTETQGDPEPTSREALTFRLGMTDVATPNSGNWWNPLEFLGGDDAASAQTKVVASVATKGRGAFGAVAQSVGAGGGVAYFSGETNLSGVFTATLGGHNSKGDGGTAQLDGAHTITTHGDLGFGSVAQSVGGGGGIAMIDQGGITGGSFLTLGGTGTTSNGGDVQITKSGHIDTYGAHSIGVLGQSIGGGGGVVTFGNVGEASFAFDQVLLGTANQSTAGTVRIDTEADSLAISTRGRGAHGILAQSIGGGGGLVVANNHVFADPNTQPPLAFANNSRGGSSIVRLKGQVTTSGEFAHGIFAQSSDTAMVIVQDDASVHQHSGIHHSSHANGSSGAETVVAVLENSSVTTHGEGAHGVLATTRVGSARAGGGKTAPATIHLHDNSSVMVTGENASAVHATVDLSESRIGTGSIVAPADNTSVRTAFAQNTDPSDITFRQGSRVVANSHASQSALSLRSNVSYWDVQLDGDVFGWQGSPFDATAAALDIAGDADVHIGQTGHVRGNLRVAASDSEDAPHQVNLSVDGTFEGAITGVNELRFEKGSQLLIPLDPTGAQNDAPALSAKALYSGLGEIIPQLTSLQPIAPGEAVTFATFENANWLGGDQLRGSGAVSFTYSVPDSNTVQITDYRVDFGGLGFDGNRQVLAKHIQTQVDYWQTHTPNSEAEQHSYDQLRALINSPTRDAVTKHFDRMDPTQTYGSAQNGLNMTGHQIDAMHSCGTVGGAFADLQEGTCFWVKPSTRKVTLRNGAGASRASGLTAGRQIAVNDAMRLSFGLGYHGTSASKTLGTTSGEVLNAGVTLKFIAGDTLLTGSLIAGRSQETTTRSVGGETATSSHTVDSLHARVRAARSFDMGWGAIRPIIDLDFGRTYHHGATETGLTAGNLSIAPHSTTFASLRPAVRFTVERPDVADGTLRGYAELGVRAGLSRGNLPASVDLGEISSDELMFTNNRRSTDGTLSLGAQYITDNGTEFVVEYAGEFGNHRQSNTLSAKMTFSF